MTNQRHNFFSRVGMMTVITSANITSTNTNQSLISNQSSAVVQSESVINSESDLVADESQENQSTVEISTRGQKIQKLNEEFFSGDPSTFEVTSELINRLEEYELITTGEAESIRGLSSFSDSSSNTADSSVTELLAFIESFMDAAKRDDPDNSIVDVMQQAQTVLDNFNDPTESSLAINIPQVKTQLQEYIASSSAQLSDSDQVSLNQLVSALTIAKALTPGTNTTAEINQYLAVNKL